MAKLKDDEIRWILSLDAGGVQTELTNISNQSRILEQDNKRLSTEIKEASAQMNAAEKEMIKLQKAGKETSSAYAEAKGTFESAKAEIADYKTKVEANTVAIGENNAKAKEVIQTMKLQDMTMSQLKGRAAELQKQLDNTSQAASPDAYKKLQKELGNVHSAMGELNNKNQNLIQQFAGMANPVGSAAQSIIGFAQAAKALIANPIGLIIVAIAAAFYMLKTAIEGNEDAANTFKGIMAVLGSLFDTWKRAIVEVTAALFHLLTFDFKALGKNAENLKDLGSNMTDNAKAAYEAAKAQAELNHEIDRNNDLTAVNKARISELRIAAQDITKSIEERKKAAKELGELELQNYNMSVHNLQGQYKEYKEANKNIMDVINKNSGAKMKEVEAYMEIVRSGNELSFEQRTKMANLVNDIATGLKDANDDQRKEFRSFFSDLSNMNQEYNQGRKRDSKLFNKLDKEDQKQQAADAKKAIEDDIKQNEQALEAKINILKSNRLKGLLTEEAYNKAVEKATEDSLKNELKIKNLGNEKLLEIKGKLLDAQLKMQEEFEKQHDNRKKLLEDASVAMQIETDAFNSRLKAANIFEVDLSNLTAEQLEKRTEMEEEYQKNLTKIATEAENKRFEDAKKASGLDKKDPTSLKGEELKAFEILTAQHQALLTKITEEGEKKRSDFGTLADKALLDSFKKSQDSMLQTAEATKLHNLNLLKDDYINKKNGIISQEIYNEKIIELDRETLVERLKIQKAYLATLLATQGPVTKEQQAAIKAAGLAVETTQAAINDSKIKQEEGFQKKQDALIKKYRIGSIAEMYAVEKAALDKQYKEKEISEEKYQEALLKLKLKAAKSYAQQAKQIADSVASTVTAYNQMETDNLEAEKQKQLTIAGDNAEKRAAVEADFAQKELDLKKKQADANMAIQIGQAIAGAAVAIIQTLAELGPIAGPIAAVLIGASTAFQIQSIIAQRDAIQNTTLSTGSSPASSASTKNSGLSNNGFADGGYNGGYTGDGGKYEVAGYLPDGKPYHRGEYFVAQEEMANPMIMPLVRKIENVRQQRTNTNPLPQGFSGGGFRQDGGLNLSQLHSTLAELTKTVKSLQDKPIRADINYYEFQQSQKQVNASFNLGKRQ